MNWLQLYNQYTKDHFSPSFFHLWVGISCISTVLERKVWVKLFADRIYPHQYIVLVAPPGLCGKGAAMAMGKRILKPIDNLTFGPNKVTMEKLFRIMADSQNTYMLDGKIQTHSSVTMISDELAVFMTPRNEELIDFLTEIWSAEHLDIWDYKTKNSGEDIVIGPWLNILGGTTPAFFNTPIMLKAIGGGFSARTLFLYSEWPRRVNLCPKAIKEMESLVEPLTEGLEKIHQLKGEFTLTDDAFAWFRPWVENAPQELIPNAAMAVFKFRLKVHLLKLAICLSAAEGGNGMKVTKHNLKMALKYLKDVEWGMQRIFTGVGKAPTTEDCKTLLIYMDRAKRPISFDEIKRDLWQDIEPDKFMSTIGILIGAKKIKQVEKEGGLLVYEKVQNKKEKKEEEIKGEESEGRY